MAYTKTTWVNNQAPAINADNLNKIEDGIYNSVRYADAQSLTDAQMEQARDNIAAAPSGFGWGEESPRRVSTAAEVDAITANSVVRYANDSTNLVDGDSNGYTRYAIVVTYTVNATDKAQDVYCYGGGAHGDVMLHRGRFGNTWLPWEWVNPPMQLGVEYRTTERYGGAVVTRKLVDCGAIANGKTVQLADNSKYRIISANVRLGSIPIPYWHNGYVGTAGSTNVWSSYFNIVGTSIALYCGDSAAESAEKVLAEVRMVAA